ncbi:hypothetical protein BDF14DRAFT_1163319 [Spinellus fusiger]|nr:hypothetical protein BDF14DRAFT_1163319 [Spinellus fusiger]
MPQTLRRHTDTDTQPLLSRSDLASMTSTELMPPPKSTVPLSRQSSLPLKKQVNSQVQNNSFILNNEETREKVEEVEEEEPLIVPDVTPEWAISPRLEQLLIHQSTVDLHAVFGGVQNIDWNDAFVGCSKAAKGSRLQSKDYFV